MRKVKEVEWIIENHKKGFLRRKDDIQESVKEFLEKTPRPNPFVNNYASEGWYKSFFRRHPEAIRTSEAVTSASFDYILNDPHRIFNGDETCFNLCPKDTKVLAPKSAKNVYEVEHASSKTTITVMFTLSAAGNVTPPMIIFPNKRLPANISKSVQSEWSIGLSESGWMRSELEKNVLRILKEGREIAHKRILCCLTYGNSSNHWRWNKNNKLWKQKKRLEDKEENTNVQQEEYLDISMLPTEDLEVRHDTNRN
ncbi:hypothetical protein NQ314_000508 [Rhamnusium bicolor]|uniref:HTH CENPB-type domain-containing protein n=1 Tax=Rhamnusium bicolor TaxID=1586634 RepID=A0AAV8ZVX5_9CUCU|nr:hypothetical protein NQ314_000508 [Rhamnusium bicolor]